MIHTKWMHGGADKQSKQTNMSEIPPSAPSGQSVETSVEKKILQRYINVRGGQQF